MTVTVIEQIKQAEIEAETLVAEAHQTGQSAVAAAESAATQALQAEEGRLQAWLEAERTNARKTIDDEVSVLQDQAAKMLKQFVTRIAQQHDQAVEAAYRTYNTIE